MQNSLVMADAPGIPRAWEILFVQALRLIGEIDFVAAPNLTVPGFTIETIMGHQVRVETSVEIIAKKLWHRGDRPTFDEACLALKNTLSAMIEATAP